MKALAFFLISIPFFLSAQDDTVLVKRNFRGSDKLEKEYYVLRSDTNLMHGSYRAYHYNRKLYITGRYEQGRREGEWISYYENGNMETHNFYCAGQYCGTCEYYGSDGKLESTFNIGSTGNSVYLDEVAFSDELRKALNYPIKAYEKDVQGSVVISILRDSACHQLVQLLQGFDYDCDKEAVRAVKQVLRSFSLGPCRNQQLTFPIYFRLGRE